MNKCISVLKPGGYLVISQLFNELDNSECKLLKFSEIESLIEDKCIPITLTGVNHSVMSNDKYVVDETKYMNGKSYILFAKKKI